MEDEVSFITTIKLSLRRTLLLSVILFCKKIEFISLLWLVN